MNNKNFISQIKKLKNEKRLAHLYLVRHELQFNGQHFFQSLIENLTGIKIDSHPDFLHVVIDDDESSYKVDSKNIQTFLKFINYYPSNLDHRFVLINDAHLISEVLLNKLLKTFEELNPKCSIFLLVPYHESILATIKSRSIEIYLQNDSYGQMPILKSDEYKDLFKKGQLTLDQILRNEVDQQKFTYQSANELVKNIKQVSKAQKFHNSNSVSLSLLLP